MRGRENFHVCVMFFYGVEIPETKVIHPQGGAPPVISWFIIPITIDITPITPSYSTYKPTERVHELGHHLVWDNRSLVVSWNWGTNYSYHRFLDGIFPNKNHPASDKGVAQFWTPPYVDGFVPTWGPASLEVQMDNMMRTMGFWGRKIRTTKVTFQLVMGLPQWLDGRFQETSQPKMDDLGVPLFCGNTHMFVSGLKNDRPTWHFPLRIDCLSWVSKNWDRTASKSTYSLVVQSASIHW